MEAMINYLVYLTLVLKSGSFNQILLQLYTHLQKSRI